MYRSLLHHGVQIYEYQPQILHSKLFIFDDVTYAGSANMDKRSLQVNYELLVRIKDQTLATEARQLFDRTLEHCLRIEWEKWKHTLSFWQRLQQQWAYFALSRVDPFLTQLQLRVLQREIRDQLPASATFNEPNRNAH
jgi:cardiolipin synthase